MNLEAIRIAIDTGELEKAKKLLGDVENQAKKTDKGISSLTDSFFSFKGVIATIATSAVISNLIKMSDTFTNIESKLKLATKSTNEYAKAQSELFKIAQESRVAFSDTVDLYSKLAISTQNLKLSQEQLLRVTETINKAGIIGGGTKESINAALVQLGQGFASGTLRGEELNSVLEQTPRLARAIAEGMGVTVGELRKLGEQGLITSEQVARALMSQSKAIDTEFGSVQKTISQSMTQIENSLIRAVGQVDNMTDSSNKLGSMMSWLAKGIDSATESLKNYELANLRIQDIRKITSIEDMKKAIELLNEEEKAITSNTDLLSRTERALMSQEQIEAKLIDIKVKKRDLTKQLIDTEASLVKKTDDGNKSNLLQISSFDKLDASTKKVIDAKKVLNQEYQKMRDELKKAGLDTPENINKVNQAEKQAIADMDKKNSKESIDLKKQEIKYANDLSKEYQDLAKIGMTEYEQKLYDINLQYVDFIKKGGDTATGLALIEEGTRKLNEEYAKKGIQEYNDAIDKQLVSTRAVYDLKEKQVGLLDDESQKNSILAGLYNQRQKEELKALLDKKEITQEFYDQSVKYEDELLQKNLQRYSVTGQIIEEVGSGMKSTMMDFFDYTSDGFGNMKKMVIDVGNMIYQAIVKQMVVNPLVSAATSAATSFFSPAPTKWEGGISDGQGFQKFSTGYLAGGGFASYDSKSNDTIPALISKGEAVIPASVVNNNRELIGALINSRGTAKFADGYVANSSNGAVGNVKVEIKNESGEQLKVSNATTRQDMEGTVISIVLNAINTNKMGMRTALGGR